MKLESMEANIKMQQKYNYSYKKMWFPGKNDRNQPPQANPQQITPSPPPLRIVKT